MRRLPTALFSVALLTPAVVLGPVLRTPSAPAPHPVAPALRTVAPDFTASGVSPRTAGGPAVATAAPQSTGHFSTLAVSWPASMPAGDQVQVRTRDGSGAWSDWTTVGAEDAAPDPGTPDARSAASHDVGTVHSEPLFAGSADMVQTRVVGAASAPSGLRVQVIDPGTSAADANPSGRVSSPNAASAAPAQPGIYSRAQWGADESLRSRNPGCGTPSYAPTVKVAFVHHTDGTNSYTPDQVPAIIRGIYAYHVLTNGWCDIGYNFLIDQFGRIWEGRYGGITQAVVGAQAGGFNYMSTGIAMLGTFDSVTPSSAALSALQTLLAWKLSLTYADPTGRTSLVSAGGPDTAYPAGTVVPLRVVSGHRDADQTSCPGQALYNLLPGIASAARTLLGTALITPNIAVQQPNYLVTPSLAITAGLTAPSPWTLTITNATKSVVRTISGAGSSIALTVPAVDDAGVRLPPGNYTGTITAGTALPYTQPFTIGGLPDVWEVGAAGTGTGNVEVYAMSGASNWQSLRVGAITAMAAVDPQQWRFFVAPYDGDGQPDLYGVHLYDTASGKVEVHVLSAASNYQTYVAHIATALAAVNPDQFQIALGPYLQDGAEDLFAIAYAGTGSGMTEVHVLSAASGYQTWLAHVATVLGPTTPGAFDFEVVAPWGDLAAIKLDGASGFTELHVLSAYYGYQAFILHRALPLAPQPTTTQFQVTDVTGDGVPDLLVLLQQNTGSAHAEVHAIDGAGGFTTWAIHAATGFPELNPDDWRETFTS